MYRAPSPICVVDLKKKIQEKVEIVNLDSDESDVEVVERNANDDIIEIRESPDREFSTAEEDSNSSFNSSSNRKSSPSSAPIVVVVPEKPKWVIDNLIIYKQIINKFLL